MNKIGIRVQSIFPVVVLALFFVLFTGYPIWDPDFFWHLKTGEYIVHHGEIPGEDIFSYTTPPGETLRKNFVLKQYWLAQVIFYLVWESAGVAGVVALRAVLLSLGLLLMYLLVRKDVEPLLLSGVLFLCGAISMDFTGDRPQLFSFFATALLFFIVESYRAKGGKIIYGLPLLTCSWSNLHGGVVLGDALLMLYVASEGIQWAAFSRPGKGAYLKFLAICLISIGASLLNPNTYHLFVALYRFYGSASVMLSPEFLSPVTIALQYGKVYWAYFLAVALACTAAASVVWKKGKKADISRISAVSFLGGIALLSARYMIFFAVAFPLIFVDVESLLGNRARRLRVLLAAAVLVASCYFLSGRDLFSFSVSRAYPGQAVEFIRRTRPAGNLLNYFDWGGYLIAALPEYKVFIDGRGLDENVQVKYNLIISASTVKQNNRPEWQSMMDSYDIGAVLMPLRDFNTGEAIPLSGALMKDPGWRLGYADGTAVVFLRRAAVQ